MTNEQIIKKVIEKAVKNRWDHFELEVIDLGEIEPVIRGKDGGSRLSIEEIIFSHDFAKAYWKDEKVEMSNPITGTKYKIRSKDAWKHHQHQMLTEVQEGRDPIKYLGKFL